MKKTSLWPFFLGLFFLAVLSLSGCALMIPNPSVDKASSKQCSNYFLRTIVRDGKLTFATQNYLRGNLLLDDVKDAPEKLLDHLQTQYWKTSDPQFLAFIADICYNVGESKSSPEEAASYYLTAALYSYAHLFRAEKMSTKQDTGVDKYDPVVCQCVMRYNTSLYKLFNYLKENNLLLKDSYEMKTATGFRVKFCKPLNRLPFTLESYKEFVPCSDFNIRNMEMISQTFGIGLPLLAVVGDEVSFKNVKMPDYFPQPATMTLAFFMSQNLISSGETINAQFMFFDPCGESEVMIKDETVPLFQDYSTPIAAMSKYMPEPPSLLRTFFFPSLIIKDRGLYMLEGYHPKQIPVVFVHGLMSSPMTWMRMINMLNNYPEIRDNYQFWLFSYPSTDSIFSSSIELAKSLVKAREELATTPESRAAFDKMVIVGHSMGGLLTRLIMLDDTNAFIDAYGRSCFGKDWDGIYAQIQPQLREMGVKDDMDFVKRIVLMAVPHRGAKMAHWKIVRWLAGFIELPQNFAESLQEQLEWLALNSNVAATKRIKRDFNRSGLEYLDPDDNVIKILQNAPFASNIPKHSIIGDIDCADAIGGGDGIVSYSSSHLDGVESELVVKSAHNVQKTPAAIMELIRILKLHLKENNVTGDTTSKPLVIPLDKPIPQGQSPAR